MLYIIIVIVGLYIILGIFLIIHVVDHRKTANNKSIKENENPQDYNFEEMENIEKVRKLVEEWEGFDLCAPGDWASSAADRCHEFKFDCHKCLLEYAYTHQDASLISENLEKIGEELKQRELDSNIQIFLEKLNDSN